VEDAAHQYAKLMETAYAKFMVGPAEPVVNRVRNMYMMDLLFKLPRDSQAIQKCKSDILKYCAVLHQNKRFAKVIIVPDVDAI
jgi:primosomal protein N' (replication factor Y)